MQQVDLPTSFTKLNENCGLPDLFTDYQIRHLGNPSGLPEILLKIDPCIPTFAKLIAPNKIIKKACVYFGVTCVHYIIVLICAYMLFA